MWPLGSYDRMVHDIKWRENKDIAVTFGILIADYRQRLNREYILNYLDRFNYKSDKYINFYLPGYLEESTFDNDKKITIGGKKYYFSEELYNEFLTKLDKDVQIKFPYTPILLLIEYNNGHFNMSEKVCIELDSDSINIKKTGDLFEKIFFIAQKEVSLKEIKSGLKKEAFKSGLLGSIIEGLDNSIITAIHNQYANVKNYKVI